MSAKITVIIYIVVSLEIGLLLVIIPWYSQFWEENYFLYLMTEKFNAGWLPPLVTSGWMRGAVTGLGLLNIVIGIREIAIFRRVVADLNQRTTSRTSTSEAEHIVYEAEDTRATGPAALPHHQSQEFPTHPER